MEKIYSQVWIDLSRATRNHLIKVFGLIPNGIAEIRDQVVISDGFTNADLERINAPKMAEYVGSDASFSRLWELTLAKVKYELNPPIILKDLLKKEQTIGSVSAPTAMIKSNKFCDFCDAKGVKHKAVCTKPGVVNGFESKTLKK